MLGIPLLKLPVGEREDETWDRYLSSCQDYIKRQVLVYQNWPQRRFDALGYLPEKVFPDMNA